MRTEFVNGSAFSSHTRATSSSLDTTPPPAAIRASSTANSFGVRSTGRPSRSTVWRAGAGSRAPARRGGGGGGGVGGGGGGGGAGGPPRGGGGGLVVVGPRA